MNSLICSGDGAPESVTVTSSSTPLICTIGDVKMGFAAKYLRISNLSANYVFIAVNHPAELNKGLVLAPKGTPGWFVEFNNDNMIYGTFNAIAEGSSTVAMMVGG